MGEFLGPHGAGFALGSVEQACLLHHFAARFIDVDLALGFVFDGLHDEAHGIDVLDFGAGAHFLFANLANADVDVGAHRPLLHIAVAGFEITHDGTQLAQIDAGLLGAAQVGLGDDLHQAYAGAVEVDE